MSVRALIQSTSSQQGQKAGGSAGSGNRGSGGGGGGASGGRSNLRETIHSGHFMVSDFEPESEAQDEEYEVGMPIPPGPPETLVVKAPALPTEMSMLPISYGSSSSSNHHVVSNHPQSQLQRGGSGIVMKRERSSNSTSAANEIVPHSLSYYGDEEPTPAISIDGSLTKLFQCMSLAYRQKLTSPKWNRFKGVRLRWKDKIRLNNVIWRCWHMQFIMKKKTLVCQFAAPLDVDGHNKPEVCCPQAVVMEGKYWKRKLSTVAAEYKKWRLFYRNRMMGWTHATPTADLHPVSLDGFDWSRSGTFGSNIIFDDDMFMDFTDTLFSSLSSNQPFAFPTPKEMTRVGMVADFIQPGLVQLQPNLDDFMDTLEPLQDYVNSKLLPPVPEELESFDSPESILSDHVLPHNHNNHVGQHNGKGAQGYYEQTTVLLQQHNGATSQSQNNDLSNHSHNKGGRQHQHQQQIVTTTNDGFAKPQGKPRGRTRSGGAGRSSSNHQPSHQQQLVNNANSNTLLSHLLANHTHHSNHHVHIHTTTNSNLPALPAPSSSGNSNNGGGGNSNNSDYGNMTPLNMILTEQYPSPQFHLPSPNTPLVINFGGMGGKSSPLLSSFSSPPAIPSPTGNNQAGSSGGSGGSISPPLGPSTSTPSSPPKGGRKGGGASTSGGEGGSDRGGYKEHRRVSHINAEQKRRCNIKNGFDTLHSLIPQLSHNPNAKVSKAAMLAKGAEYIRQLKVERAQLKDEIERHRADVEGLNAAINNCQSMLPATGAPVSRQRTSKMNEMFYIWVRQRTLENWKFWLFSTLIRPLLDSYNNSVSTASVDELCRTVLAWVDQHCSLVDLRPAVLTSLRQLCTSTDILSNPANLQEEAYKAVNRPIPHQDRGGGGDSR